MTTQSSPTILKNLLLLLAPLRFAAENEEYVRNLAAAVGWDLDEVVGFDAAAATADLRVIAEGVDAIAKHVVDPPDTLSEFLEALDSAADTFTAIRDLGEILNGAGDTHLEDFGKALLEAFVIVGWLQQSPISFSIAEMLGVVVGPDDGPLLPAITDGDRVLRVEHRRGELRFDRLEPLLRDPVAALREEYFANDALATTAGAHQAADKLFFRLARLALLLGLDARYGFNPQVAITGGDAVRERLAHMLTLYVSPNDGDQYGLTLALSAADRGDRGLLVQPFGAITFASEVDDWKLRISGTGSVTGLLLSPDGVETRGGESFGLAIEAERSSEFESADTTIGSSSTGVTFGNVRVKGELELGQNARNAGLSLVVEKARFALAGSEGDGFLSSILPPEGLSADVEFSVGWSSKHGFHFSGSAGLETTWPLDARFGPVRVDSLSLAIVAEDSAIQAQASFNAGLNLGPFAVRVERVGLSAFVEFPENGGNLGVANLDFGFKPPTGLGLLVDAPTVVGGGFLRFEPQKGEYSGVLELKIAEKISVKGFGLLSTKLPNGRKGYSFVVIIFVEGFAPIPLGFGFSLTGIGGLLAINRTFDETALRAGLKEKTLDSIMFPKDPIRNAPQIISNLNRVFPAASGNHLFGPMVQISWGTPTLITIEMAVVLEFGKRLRLLILAQVAAILPEPKNDLVRIQMDAVGLIDFDQGLAELDAVLYDSRLLKKFVLTGEMAMRLRWRNSPNFALAVGGVHPAFNPPQNFPKLERLALNLSSGDNPRLRCEAYFAITSNTVQWGARAELYASAAGFSVHGDIGYDVLIQFDPFFFIASFHAQLQLKRGSTNLFKVRLEGELSGPRPLHIKGRATFEILWWDFTVRIDKTLVQGEKPPLPAPINVLPLLEQALTNPGNWAGQLPAGRPLVTLRADVGTARGVFLHPLGALTVKQNVVPLNFDISRFGQAAPAGARRFAIGNVSLGGFGLERKPVNDFFARAQFVEMSDDKKLSTPSFETMEAGLTMSSDAFSFSASPADWLEVNAIEFETWIMDEQSNELRPAGGDQPESKPALYRLRPELLLVQAKFGAAGSSDLRRTGNARYRTTTIGRYQVAKEGWSIVSTDNLAVQPAAAADAAKPQTYSEATRRLEEIKQRNPAQAAGLKILRLSEVRKID